jgi:hypothetical protein
MAKFNQSLIYSANGELIVNRLITKTKFLCQQHFPVYDISHS